MTPGSEVIDPSRTKVGFMTFGCSLNQADSETIAGVVQEAGYQIASDVSQADIVIINSCTVKNLAQTKLFRSIRDLEAQGKKIVIAGCVPQADHSLVKGELARYSIIGTTQLARIDFVVEESLKGNVVQLLNREKNPRLNLPKVRHNPVIEIIPICEGCLNFCVYCKTKHARGNLLSYDPQAIIAQAQNAISDGCKEIWLTSQDCGAYGRDIGTNIAELLRRVLALDGYFMVRLGMSNPHHVLAVLDDLVEVYKHPKMFKFLHIPVQAGSDRILDAMKREYHREDFVRIVKRFREDIPQVTISSDIICGFPTETAAEFEETMRLMEDLRPEVLNISRFWKRPGTPAVLMEQLPGAETKERSTHLKAMFDRMCVENNKQWIGWSGKILIDEQGTKPGTWLGRNEFYKPIVVCGNHALGDVITVKVASSAAHHLLGIGTTMRAGEWQ